MMAERLAEIRRQTELGFEHANDVVRELLGYIAQLEAHKAESMQVFAALQIQEIAKEIGAPLGSGVAEHILPWIKSAKAQLEAQRGGAVVVPTKMDDDDWEAIGFQQSTEGQLQRVWDRAVSRIQPIPADRVLADGMVGVDREELMYLHAFEKYARKHGPESIQDVAGTLDHLRRAQQAKGE